MCIYRYKELTEKSDVAYIAGGSVQNSLRVAQWIIQKPNVTTFFGSVGKDDFSKILADKARSDGVNLRYQYQEDVPTGTCGVLLTGHHRSLCAYLGAANNFTIDHINLPENKTFIKQAKYFYISVSYILLLYLT